jgi:hypothetical protein
MKLIYQVCWTLNLKKQNVNFHITLHRVSLADIEKMTLG